MSGYRRVNYYELCRLCTSSEGSKLNIFRDEGRRRQLQMKIQTCLPIQVLEEDSLPKIVCHECIKKLESFMEFREAVVTAESMLESYFTSLRFSEDFLKEGKVYVKNTEKERPRSPDESVIPITHSSEPCNEEDPLKSVDKIPNSQVISAEVQNQHPVLVSNVNASNIQIISGVQARVQQYKCAMQMQGGGVAAAVVEATAETHYSYQQQTSQQVTQQQNQTHNQITEHSQSNQLQQVQNQLHNQNQINQQSLRQMTQQPISNPTNQINQPQNQSLVNQQQAQSHIVQQIQQLQRQQREFEKQQRHLHHVEKQQEQQVHSIQNNNIVLKHEDDSPESGQQVIQKVQSDTPKNDINGQSIPTYTTMQTPEVFLNLGFKDNSLTTQTHRDESKDLKTFIKADDTITRSSIGPISEFLKIRAGPESSSLIPINPQMITQTTKHLICRDCGKSFSSINQMNGHSCGSVQILNDHLDIQPKEDPPQVNGNNQFPCEVCGKPFKRKEHLFQHRKLHTGERPYICTTCSKAFSRKEHLVRHLVSHTGQKMHECDMCGKSFSRKDNLHKHRKTHGVSGPYICETCGKSFVIKHYYLIHLTTHTPVTVDGVASTGSLPYKCDICQRAFSVKQYLTTHKLRHRSKNNITQSNGTQQHQSQQSNEINVTEGDISGSGNLSDGSAGGSAGVSGGGGGNSGSGGSNGSNGGSSMTEMQSVIERNEQQTQSGSFSSSQQYQGNLSQFQ